MTLQEYLDYDVGTDTDSHRYELEDGVLVEMAPERALNNTIVFFLVSRFSQIGVLYYCFASNPYIQVDSKYVSARQPDLIVHSKASIAAILEDGRLLRLDRPTPDLALEVVSSSDTDKRSRDRDYTRKRSEYAQRGISEYWIVDPIAEAVLVLTLAGGAYPETKFTGEDKMRSPQFSTLNLSAKQILKAGL